MAMSDKNKNETKAKITLKYSDRINTLFSITFDLKIQLLETFLSWYNF